MSVLGDAFLAAGDGKLELATELGMAAQIPRVILGVGNGPTPRVLLAQVGDQARSSIILGKPPQEQLGTVLLDGRRQGVFESGVVGVGQIPGVGGGYHVSFFGGQLFVALAMGGDDTPRRQVVDVTAQVEEAAPDTPQRLPGQEAAEEEDGTHDVLSALPRPGISMNRPLSWQAIWPPSTMMSCPVRKPASSDSRKAQTAAMSSPVPYRSRGICLR